MKTKGDVGADLYVEDSPNNIKALQDAGKDVLIFTNSTNKTVQGQRANTWDEVEKVVMDRLKAWKK
jgi:beta-phosphoglucomutase-like phosphatase (HAD superfamily)